jgi:hypothetical protein
VDSKVDSKVNQERVCMWEISRIIDDPLVILKRKTPLGCAARVPADEDEGGPPLTLRSGAGGGPWAGRHPKIKRKQKRQATHAWRAV